jgi:hypothetical protein
MLTDAMSGPPAEDELAFRRFVDDNRERCLWFLRADYYPATREDAAQVLQLIERYGDRRVLSRVADFRRWLSRRFSETSAAG